MKRRTYPEQQQLNPCRKPCWRWLRACDLINTGRYMSRKRDDEATGVAVQYVREINRSLTELRLRRVRQRFQHVATAHDIWQHSGMEQLEIQTRILSRQNDIEIGLEMDLPAPTIQAYRDIFFHVDDRINATSYIQFQIIAMHPRRPPTPIQLMQMCVYHHGPHAIEPWLTYLRDDSKSRDLTTTAGRMAASIDLLLSVHSLPDDAETRWSLLKRMPFLLKNEWKFAVSVPAAAAFRKSTHGIIGDLELPRAELAPTSYAPAAKSTSRRQARQAA